MAHLKKIRVGGLQIKKKVSLKAWSWWQVGGFADYFCEPENEEQLQEALVWAGQNNQKVSVLGGGTNLLISDQGVEGLVLSTSRLNHISVEQKKDQIFIHCLCGTLKSQVMKVFKKYKLAPAIFLSGIPGNMGGGLVMNAGVGCFVKPSEFSEIVHSFQLMTAQGLKTYQKSDLKWSYRKTSGMLQGVVYKIQLKWPLREVPDLNERIKAELVKRRKSQPLGQASCGSVFKNPYPQCAGELIEKVGLKGMKRGSAEVSKKHANFILNLGGAKAEDIHHLIQTVRQKVYDRFSIFLEREVHYMGRGLKNEKTT